jgi:hypothetical protein
MDKRNQIIILVGLPVSLIVVPVVVALVNQSAPTPTNSASQALTTTPAARTSNDIIVAIEKADSSLKDSSGKPTFSLLGFKRLAGNWYVAWIDTNNTKVLINDPAVSAENMYPLMGPDTNFTEGKAVAKGIPVTVFKEFIDATP